jgi:hypothetical protein
MMCASAYESRLHRESKIWSRPAFSTHPASSPPLFTLPLHRLAAYPEISRRL